MVAQPIDKGLDHQLEYLAGNVDKVDEMLIERFDWDPLTASSLWSFGPTRMGTNMLIDYSLGFETDATKLKQAKNSLVQGF